MSLSRAFQAAGPILGVMRESRPVARLHVPDELLQLAASSDRKICALLDGRGILEHYLA